MFSHQHGYQIKEKFIFITLIKSNQILYNTNKLKKRVLNQRDRPFYYPLSQNYELY